MTTERGVADERLHTALEPVRLALLEDAGREAEAITSDAEAEAEAVLGRARSEADTAVERAVGRAEAARRARNERALALARADADRRVLKVRSQLRRDLLAAARRTAVGLRRHPRYPDLLDRLEELARAQLGDPKPDGSDSSGGGGVIIERDPEPDGGVIGTDGRRRVDYTLPALADRAAADLADEVAAPWN